MFRREACKILLDRLAEPRRFIQVLAGPRQVGKTTAASQVIEAFDGSSHFVSADEPTLRGKSWLAQQWEIARQKAAQSAGGVLVLDEVQKIPDWSEAVKRLWDEDTAAGRTLHVVLLGSSPLLVQSGLTESLAGRFEIVRMPHWSYPEMHEAFGWDLDTYVFFGGYPGSVALAGDFSRWRAYIHDSVIETSVARDVLLMNRVDKPVLLRTLLELACGYSAQILSYHKMLGQLTDAGNTTTLAHYLQLLGGAGMVTGLTKYAGQRVRRRGSSPKLLALNTALMSAVSSIPFDRAKEDREHMGRLVETAVGAHLVNSAWGSDVSVRYWAAGNCEVDFVMARGDELIALEVKSGWRKARLPGITAFASHFPLTKSLLVGTGEGIPLKDFLSAGVRHWFDRG